MGTHEVTDTAIPSGPRTDMWDVPWSLGGVA